MNWRCLKMSEMSSVSVAPGLKASNKKLNKSQ
uniref:Uncharacterized protein n=1 Tax=Anguilla anguilla TaxID=7936 RepID=A0A0E9PC17_ANGAN